MGPAAQAASSGTGRQGRPGSGGWDSAGWDKKNLKNVCLGFVKFARCHGTP